MCSRPLLGHQLAGGWISQYAVPGENQNWAAIGDEGGSGLARENRGPLRPVDSGSVTFEGGVRSGPHLPAGVLDAVFGSPAGAAPVVAPVMLGDELFEAAFGGECRRASGLRADASGIAIHAPFVLGGDGGFRLLDAVAHREADVVLAVNEIGGQGDGATRDDLADENDAATVVARDAAANVEAEVHFVEIGVNGNRENSGEPGAEKAEADEACVRATVEGMELGARRDVRAQEVWVHFIVQEQEVAPLGREEDARREMPGVLHRILIVRQLRGNGFGMVG